VKIYLKQNGEFLRKNFEQTLYALCVFIHMCIESIFDIIKFFLGAKNKKIKTTYTFSLFLLDFNLLIEND
jgi:hypothetical protein